MRSTGDIQFFVCRLRIIPEPSFPSQGIAGSGNEIAIEVATKISECCRKCEKFLKMSLGIKNFSEYENSMK